MKILISAYACDPFKGSEPGVGWTSVCRIARSHDVFVLTDIHNRDGWNKAFHEKIVPENVSVRFLRNKSACNSNRLIAHLQSWLNYASFTRQVLNAAKVWYEEEKFDLCHQVTIAGWRMPSPLWKLPIPFIWGPIGGAGFIPTEFRSMLSTSSQVFERARDLNTWISSRSTAFHQCITNAAMVFAANEETEEFLRPFRNDLPMMRLPIASVSDEKITRFTRTIDRTSFSGPLRLFAGGNMEGRKGLSLALKALAQVAKKGIDFRYTIAGGGPEINSLKQLAQDLTISDKVVFHDGFSGEQYIRELHATDVYFLPSFRESTPVTLLEACIAGCYPVVADASAQGEIIRLVGGTAVAANSQLKMIEGLTDAIIWCAKNRPILATEAKKAAQVIRIHYSSDRYDKIINDTYLKVIK